MCLSLVASRFRLTQSVSTTYFSGSAASVTEAYEHDARGRSIGESGQFSLPASWNVTTALPTYQEQLSYNDADQLTTTTTSAIPSGPGFTTTQVYDATTGVKTGLSNNTSNTPDLATVSYNSQSQLASLNLLTTTGGQLAIDSLGYDGNLRLTSIAASWQGGSGNSGTIFSQNLTYDAASNLISLTQTQNAAGSQSGGSETSNFCYDEQNRLVWAGNSGTQPGAGKGTCGSATLADTISGANYADAYVYTHLGQLWQAPRNGGTTQYQYLYCNSQPHELTGLYAIGSTCSSHSGQGYASSYDAFGNVTSRSAFGTTGTLTYDLLDHFTQWYVGANNQEQYLYDASGQRLLRRVTNSTSTTIITYPFGIEEHLYSGSGTNQSNTYYYFLAGHLLGSLDSNGTQFYLTDALGSLISSFTNAAGGARMKSNQLFGPYGNARYTAGNLNTAKGFIGQYNDNTGLDYFNARYYDPVAGVFLSADTKEGNPQGMNPYMYVKGNPETYSDPSGHMRLPPPGGWYIPTDDSGAPLPPPQTPPVTLQSPVDPATYNAPAIATGLAKKVKAFRATRPDRMYRYDMGAGVWYITGADGTMLIGPQDITLNPVKGSNIGGHAEVILLQWWLTFKSTQAIGELLTALADGQNAQLHIVLFSQLDPCGPCRSYFDQFMQGLASTMNAMRLADPFGPDAPMDSIPVVTLDVFASTYIPIKDDPLATSQAVWPGTTDSYGVTDYWNGAITFDPGGFGV